MSATHGISFVSQNLVSQQEFEEWLRNRQANDSNRYELLEGRIVMNPPANWPEGEGEGEAYAALRAYVRPRRLGRVFGSGQGFVLPTGDTVAPDASFIGQDRWERGRPEPGSFIRIVPDLAIEVLSPNDPARDLVQKRIIYARSGVREYWVVDLHRAEVTVFHSVAEGQFDGGQVCGESDTIQSQVLPGLEVPVRELLIER